MILTRCRLISRFSEDGCNIVTEWMMMLLHTEEFVAVTSTFFESAAAKWKIRRRNIDEGVLPPRFSSSCPQKRITSATSAAQMSGEIPLPPQQEPTLS